MATAVTISLIFAALTAAYFIIANIESYRSRRRLTDILGALWSLALTVWFGYAAVWLFMNTR